MSIDNDDFTDRTNDQSSTDLGYAGTDLSSADTDLGYASTDIGYASSDLGTAGTSLDYDSPELTYTRPDITYTEQTYPSQGGSSESGGKGDFLLGMLIGAAVGAAAALMYAPSAGRETRNQLRNRAEGLTGSLRNQASNVASQVRDQASSVASSVSDSVQDLTNTGGEALGDLPDTRPNNRRDQHELQVSDEPDVVADRINSAFQGSGPEAQEIAEQLSQAPTAHRDSTL